MIRMKGGLCGGLFAVAAALVTLGGADSLYAQPTDTPSTTVRVSTRDELIQAVARAQPGTIVLIAPGTYRGSLSFTDLRGTEDRPIILRAADESRPPVIEGQGAGLHLRRPAYVELHHLVFAGASGNGLNIDNGAANSEAAHHIVLRKLVVRDVGPRGNCDAIKLSGVDQFTVADCVLERWGDNGSGIDMVGCHQGLIAGCVLRHRGDIGASGIQAKGGSAQISIQRCRFEHAGGRAVNLGGSTGLDFFRPLDAPFEAREITVEDCTFIGSQAPIAFVGVDRAIVRYNTIYRPERWVVRILQESQDERFVPCRHGAFTHNLIVFRSDELRTTVNVGPGTAPETFTFAENHWYCLDAPQQSNRLSLPVEESAGRYGQDPQFVDAGRGDLRLQSDSPVENAGVRVEPQER